MKERIVELEKHRNINTVPSKAVEEDFTIEAKDKGLSFNVLSIFLNICFLGIRLGKSNDKKWFGLFGKSNGDCCC